MASSKTRQRKLERDRYERKLVRQAQRQRRKRQVQAGLGAFLALALIGAGTAWLAGVFDRDDTEPIAEADRCRWLPAAQDDPNRIDVGTPPGNPPTTGQYTIDLELAAGGGSAGSVQVTMDAADDPCGTASLHHLAAQGFYDGTSCHEIADGALRCGDPTGTGLGGPAYTFWGQNVPVPDDADDQAADADPLYPAGTVAFGDVAGENGSQFLIFFEDYSPEAPLFPVIGTVTSGLEVVAEIGAAGVAEGTTAPTEEVVIDSLTVTEGGAAPIQ